MTHNPAGSVAGLQIEVDDVETAHTELTARGGEVSNIDNQPWGRFVYFEDSDGNVWNVQELPAG